MSEKNFMPFCGIKNAFDPSSESECTTICKQDMPEEFAKCEENFKTKPAKHAPKKSTAKGGRGKSFWGHINSTQAGLIDDCLIKAIKPMQLDDIAEFAGGKVPRTLHHLKHVQKVRMDMFCKGGNILVDEERGIFFDGNDIAKGVAVGKTTSITDFVIIKKKKEKKADD